MKKRITLVAALGVLLVAGFAYLAEHNPEEGGIYPPCMFRAVTGYHCVGCGSTRATYSLVHLDLAGAFRKNPLLIVILPFLMGAVVVEGAAWILGERYRGPRVRVRAWGAWAFLIVIFTYWILRNIPAWPFTLLAPH